MELISGELAMRIEIDADLARAVFTLPQSGGAFDPDFHSYLQKLGQRRRSVLLTFPPKAAGTFLRSAAIDAIGGQLMRIVHAYGGREASPYLPALLHYFVGDPSAPTMVTHVHMQALPANRHFLDAFDLKPVIMLRSVPDMLCSYIDMLNAEPITPELWVNSLIPDNFATLDPETQSDFIVDIMGPWYASYFATWLDYAASFPSRVCVLRYDDFKREPATTLRQLLAHSGLETTDYMCNRAIDIAWKERALLRFNKGVHGRGAARFHAGHIAHLETMLFRHYDLSAFRDDLLPRAH
jgi:hypothetical protein